MNGRIIIETHRHIPCPFSRGVVWDRHREESQGTAGHLYSEAPDPPVAQVAVRATASL